MYDSQKARSERCNTCHLMVTYCVLWQPNFRDRAQCLGIRRGAWPRGVLIHNVVVHLKVLLITGAGVRGKVPVWGRRARQGPVHVKITTSTAMGAITCQGLGVLKQRYLFISLFDWMVFNTMHVCKNILHILMLYFMLAFYSIQLKSVRPNSKLLKS